LISINTTLISLSPCNFIFSLLGISVKCLFGIHPHWLIHFIPNLNLEFYSTFLTSSARRK
jgi:hypothetical protein